MMTKPKYDPTGELEIFNQAIVAAMARQGITLQVQLAALLDIAPPGLHRRFLGTTAWTLEDLRRLFRVLEMTSDEIAQALGVKIT